jgi:hypothetical protein
MRYPDSQKNGGARGTAKFREETSKKADSAVKDRIAAVHNLAQGHSHASKISHCSIVYSAHARIRKSVGAMMRKLSVT